MSFLLRFTTAGQVIPLGPFLDTAGAAVTTLTIANTDIKIWKSGATSEVSKNSGGATHMAGGRYYATFDATDSNTIGPGEINIHVAGALPIKVKFLVLYADRYDALLSDTTNLFNDMDGSPSIAANVRGINDVHTPAQVMSLFFNALSVLTVDTANFTPTATSVQFTASTDDEDYYMHQAVFYLDGNGKGQTLFVTGYTYDSGNSQVRLTFDRDLGTTPGNGDKFLMMGARRPT